MFMKRILKGQSFCIVILVRSGNPFIVAGTLKVGGTAFFPMESSLPGTERRRLVKISENAKTSNAVNKLSKGQNFPPGIENQPRFAAVLDTLGKTGQAKPPSEVKSMTRLTLEDYRNLALPVRQRTSRANSFRLATERSKNDDLIAPEQIQKAIEDSARKFKLPVQLVTAIIKVESNFNPRAVSSEGARGLMQLMPTTASKLGVKNSFDVAQNIHGGCRYLKGLLEQFDGNLELAVAAYNAGPGAVQKYGKIPPFKETQNYVKKVLAYC
jgi:soluble lytic murein transglycosylase-like protein